MYQINSDNPDKVTVTAPGYTAYDWFYDFTEGSTYNSYAHYKRTWTTTPDFTTTVDLPKDSGSEAPVVERNSSTATPALHKDLVNATKYVANGGTIQLLADVTTTETITITKAITLNLNGHSIPDGRTISSPGGNAFLIEIKEGADVKIMNSGAAKTITASDSGVNVIQGKLTLYSGVTIDAAKYAGIYIRGSTESTATNYAVVTVNKDAVVKGLYGVVVRGIAGTTSQGYGAVLDVSGTINGDQGIFVSGNLQVNWRFFRRP